MADLFDRTDNLNFFEANSVYYNLLSKLTIVLERHRDYNKAQTASFASLLLNPLPEHEAVIKLLFPEAKKIGQFAESFEATLFRGYQQGSGAVAFNALAQDRQLFERILVALPMILASNDSRMEDAELHGLLGEKLFTRFLVARSSRTKIFEKLDKLNEQRRTALEVTTPSERALSSPLASDFAKRHMWTLLLQLQQMRKSDARKTPDARNMSDPEYVAMLVRQEIDRNTDFYTALRKQVTPANIIAFFHGDPRSPLTLLDGTKLSRAAEVVAAAFGAGGQVFDLPAFDHKQISLPADRTAEDIQLLEALLSRPSFAVQLHAFAEKEPGVDKDINALIAAIHRNLWFMDKADPQETKKQLHLLVEIWGDKKWVADQRVNGITRVLGMALLGGASADDAVEKLFDVSVPRLGYEGPKTKGGGKKRIGTAVAKSTLYSFGTLFDMSEAHFMRGIAAMDADDQKWAVKLFHGEIPPIMESTRPTLIDKVFKIALRMAFIFKIETDKLLGEIPSLDGDWFLTQAMREKFPVLAEDFAQRNWLTKTDLTDQGVMTGHDIAAFEQALNKLSLAEKFRVSGKDESQSKLKAILGNTYTPESVELLLKSSFGRNDLDKIKLNNNRPNGTPGNAAPRPGNDK